MYALDGNNKSLILVALTSPFLCLPFCFSLSTSLSSLHRLLFRSLALSSIPPFGVLFITITTFSRCQYLFHFYLSICTADAHFFLSLPFSSRATCDMYRFKLSRFFLFSRLYSRRFSRRFSLLFCTAMFATSPRVAFFVALVCCRCLLQ